MSADRDITPRVIEYLAATLPTVTLERRVSFLVAQTVLRQLARWARRTDEPGRWLSNDSVGQLVAGTGIPGSTVRKALDCLARVGLVETVRRGGGYGEYARGSSRLVILDPTDQLRAPDRAQLTPDGQLRSVERAQFNPQLRSVEPSTALGRASTALGQPSASASSSACTSARDACRADRHPPSCACEGTGYVYPDDITLTRCPGQ